MSNKRFTIHAVVLMRAVVSFSVGASALGQTVDPRTNSWFTQYSGKYARIYTNAAAQTAGKSVTTWSNGTQTQSLPAYNGVQEVYSSSNWVYLRSTGLGIHIMGPWQTGFPNLPLNTHTCFRIPRNPTVPASKTATGGGPIGYFVDGVSMFNSWDAFTWNGSADAANTTGYWNRDAYVNEGATFDPAYAHQPQDGTYHYHASPIALRYLLGDHVDFNATTKTYSESTNVVTKHSPILAWVKDGFPVYGPYGYSNATNPASGIRRMMSGYQLRNGQNGTDNLTVTGRSTIPAWAVRLDSVTNAQSGPAVSSSYPLGRYMEDNAYLGDLGKTQGVDFDLDEYNGRFCVTPEFPNGTYAYFVSISSNGTPTFPYNIGRGYYGNPSGGSVTSLSETVVTNYVGGPNSAITLSKPSAAAGNGNVTLVWSSVEGGTYEVLSSSNLSAWSMKATNITSGGLTSQVATSKGGSMEFYQVARTALASCDLVTSGSSGGTSGGILSVIPNSAARGTSLTVTINLDPSAQPAPPPQNAPINSVTIGTISGTGLTHVSQTQVQAAFSIPENATTGAQTVTVVFPGPPNNPSQTVTYTLSNGFTVN